MLHKAIAQRLQNRERFGMQNPLGEPNFRVVAAEDPHSFLVGTPERSLLDFVFIQLKSTLHGRGFPVHPIPVGEIPLFGATPSEGFRVAESSLTRIAGEVLKVAGGFSPFGLIVRPVQVYDSMFLDALGSSLPLGLPSVEVISLL